MMDGGWEHGCVGGGKRLGAVEVDHTPPEVLYIVYIVVFVYLCRLDVYSCARSLGLRQVKSRGFFGSLKFMNFTLKFLALATINTAHALKEYNLTVTNGRAAPDGVGREGILINGELGGPVGLNVGLPRHVPTPLSRIITHSLGHSLASSSLSSKTSN